jgi:integrase
MVKVRPFRNGGFEVDIRLVLPDGSKHRERRKAPVASKSAALRWAQDRERHLLQRDPSIQRKEVPTLSEFAPRFIAEHVRANRQKPSGIAAKETIVNVHLTPLLGTTKLDAIANQDIQRLKMRLSDKAPKTVNNILTVLNTMLKKAVEWNVLDRVPCSVRLLPTPKPNVPFHDFDAHSALVDSATQLDWRAELIVLLGGDAGLRCGEMIALEWGDVDTKKRQLCIQRSEWKGHVTVPKGGRLRYVPMTARLASALQRHRHLRSSRVLVRNDGSAATMKIIQSWVARAAKKADVRGGVHVLRHTFCSHLAMRGAPARAIQELAGHQDLLTTQRYMHLSPSAIESAIRLLDSTTVPSGRGDIVETADRETAKSRV